MLTAFASQDSVILFFLMIVSPPPNFPVMGMHYLSSLKKSLKKAI